MEDTGTGIPGLLDLLKALARHQHRFHQRTWARHERHEARQSKAMQAIADANTLLDINICDESGSLQEATFGELRRALRSAVDAMEDDKTHDEKRLSKSKESPAKGGGFQVKPQRGMNCLAPRGGKALSVVPTSDRIKPCFVFLALAGTSRICGSSLRPIQRCPHSSREPKSDYPNTVCF